MCVQGFWLFGGVKGRCTVCFQILIGMLDLHSHQRLFKRNDPHVIFILTGFISSNRTKMHGNIVHID